MAKVIFKFDDIDEIKIKGRIFTLTGFDYEERDEIGRIIVEGGGTVKEYTVLKTDYLIVDDSEPWYSTSVKYDKALINKTKGSDVAIISKKQFYKLVKKDAKKKAKEKTENNKEEKPINIPQSSAEWEELFDYKKYKGDIVILGYKGNVKDVILPATIGGLTVRTIRGDAFSPEAMYLPKEQKKYRESIESVKIPDTVTEIRYGTFNGCKNLKSVNIPKRINKIDINVFSKCVSLESIDIPEGVKEIGVSAFNGCSKLKNINIPNSIKIIGSDAFKDCCALETIDLPEGLIEIGTFAFKGCRSLSEISIPETVEAIGFSTFAGCTNLKTANIPKGIIEIEGQMFCDCENLESVIMHDNIKNIGAWAFMNCSSLKTIELPECVTTIEPCAFKNCTFSDFKFPKELKTIGWDAFAGCKKLQSVELNDNIEVIGTGAFKGCKNALDFIYSSDNSFNLVWKILDKENKLVILDRAIRDKEKSPGIIRKIKANKNTLLEKAFEKDDVEAMEYILSVYDKIPSEDIKEYIKMASSAPECRRILRSRMQS